MVRALGLSLFSISDKNLAATLIPNDLFLGNSENQYYILWPQQCKKYMYIWIKIKSKVLSVIRKQTLYDFNTFNEHMRSFYTLFFNDPGYSPIPPSI